ncbi:hypothetical protein QBC39DRAFT_338296 [Podospora conica]|nr:hypothetical protein QBC39DRAFT_338296 [Schizothecium conicum]
MAAPSRLFEPLVVGNMKLQHRIAMAPLTRFRSTDEHVPIPSLMAEYYAQRASTPGTLLISEATFISPAASGYDNAPGIWNDAQVAAWRQITDAVHAKGSYIVCQLWHLGRAATAANLKRETGLSVRAPSAIPMPDEGSAVPVPLTIDDIKQTVRDYASAARNAIAAGFDAVEIHSANGYLPDQFLQDNSNQRDDAYGGSVENRSRFTVEVAEAVVAAVGAERTGIRLSPWSVFQGMRMQDPVPQFTDVTRKLSALRLAYLHLVESHIEGNRTVDTLETPDSLDFAVDVWEGPVLVAGRLDPKRARDLVDERYKARDVVATFGRYFISTPDLVFRVREGIELNRWNVDTFYVKKSAKGYLDYPFSKEFEAKFGVQKTGEQASL